MLDTRVVHWAPLRGVGVVGGAASSFAGLTFIVLTGNTWPCARPGRSRRRRKRGGSVGGRGVGWREGGEAGTVGGDCARNVKGGGGGRERRRRRKEDKG
jgi:hypothetical protein